MSIFRSNASLQVKCQQQHHEFDIRIIFTSIQIMLVSNRKYAHLGNELISSWIDDLTLNLTLSNFFQHWSFSSKSHVNCGFSVFSLVISNSTYFFSSRSSMSNVEFYLLFFVFAFIVVFIFVFSAHYSIVSFDNSLFRHLRMSHWSFTVSIIGRIAWRIAWRMKDFYELHACLTGGLNLWQKIHAMSTCDSQISMQKMHSQGIRRRSFYLKKGDSVTASAWVTLSIFDSVGRFDTHHIHSTRTFS